ncbi:hypothetical protein [Geodermatophilus amargosae]|uniref:hypothetical protein n=1 Tax=Geodermatophilus amargosae TaxID=1296565 RepID=UPI0034DE1CDD
MSVTTSTTEAGGASMVLVTLISRTGLQAGRWLTVWPPTFDGVGRVESDPSERVLAGDGPAASGVGQP